MVNWEFIDFVLKEGEVNLWGMYIFVGIWVLYLFYDVFMKKYWFVYFYMMNMVGCEFNVDFYVIWVDNINGLWLELFYFIFIGFDLVIFYDEDGRYYIFIFEWEMC